ncbi:MAG: extracellular solute-binding protein [Sphaerochaetaceae bacterium]|jgi:putative aldouronate transport system substrate-binding protein|nr:extracellular solute-binding protein [Spirochaetaceae bacterium]MDY6343212.1 extracellular solute-binding protein [Sphaerochaetaceae bacterium]
MKKALIALCAMMAVAASAFANGAKESAPSAAVEKSAAAGPTKLTYWAPLNPAIAAIANDFGGTAYWQELMKRTNTDISFQHAPAKTMADAFNVMIASGDYPDIIEYKWIAYPGGPQVAIDDGVIIPLNDVFKKYCPNITKFLDEHPDVAKMISTNDGTYYAFPYLRGEDYVNNPLLFSEGWVWRKDLLAKAGINEIPETPDEIYTALKAFQSMGVQIPVCIRPDHINRVFGPGFDSWDDFYVEDGKVHHGYLDPQRRQFLEYVHKLYAEKLLDNDYLAVDKKGLGVKILNNLAGAGYAPGGSGIGTWLPAMRKTDPSVELVSSRPISPSRDRLSKFAKMTAIYSDAGPSAAISTSCKNVEGAARLLDYQYGEDGHMLANFGIEGLTYTMVDGYPTYTDLIMHNPEGKSMSQVMANYIRATTNGPFVVDKRHIEQYYSMPELSEAVKLWAQTDYGKYMMPPVTATSEEGERLAQITNNVSTYANEMETKFIVGDTPITDETFKAYQDQLKKFGLEEAVAIKQADYDRYMAK